MALSQVERLNLKRLLFISIVMLCKFDFGRQFEEIRSSNYCACLPGSQLTFDCLTQDGVATVWSGSTFFGQCDSRQIILNHFSFSTQNNREGGQCGDSLVAYIIGEFNGTYISRLNVTVTEDKNNTTIVCAAELANTAKKVALNKTLLVADNWSSGTGIYIIG